MKRKIIALTGLILIVLILSKIGIISSKNYLTALFDKFTDNPKIVVLEVTKFHRLELKDRIWLRNKHGFDTRYANKEDLNKIRLDGILSYNREMELFIESKNGINWRENYEKDIDSILKTTN